MDQRIHWRTMIHLFIELWNIQHQTSTHLFIYWKETLELEFLVNRNLKKIFYQIAENNKIYLFIQFIISYARCIQKCWIVCGIIWNIDVRFHLHTLYAYAGWLFTWIVSSITSAINEFLRSLLPCFWNRSIRNTKICAFSKVILHHFEILKSFCFSCL